MNRFLYFLLLLMLFSCKTQQSASTFQPLSPEISSSISSSVSFTQFYQSMIEEVNSQKTLEGYVPSDSLINLYNLQRDGKTIRVKGFIDVNEQFNPDDCQKYDCYLTHIAGQQYTFSIPLQNVPQLLRLPGIVYIEKSKPVFMR